MGGSKRVVEIAVKCSTTFGEKERHYIYVHDNGFVETQGHDESEWGSDGEIYEFLGGPKDSNPCLWWKRLNSGQEETVFWSNGTFRVKGWAGHIFDVFLWRVAKLEETTDEAFATVMKGFGIDKPKDSFLSDDFSLTNIGAYAELIKIVRNDLEEKAYFSHLQELFLMCSLKETQQWINAGVPYLSIVPLKSLGVPVSVGARIHKAFVDKWTFSSQPYSLGSPEYWVSSATREGMDMDRIADYMDRTRYNGTWYWRQNVFDKVVAKCLENNLFFPTTWIVEAVASIPDREVLIEYTKGKEHIEFNSHVPFHGLDKNFPSRSEKWTRGWAYTVGTERIYENLISLGDPKNWEPGWEYPTFKEIQDDYYEEVEEQVVRK